MAQATNFTIKDGAATPVDTVFTNVQPAGGNLPATYFARAKGASPAQQPTVRISSRGMQGKREVLHTVAVPYAVTGADAVSRVVSIALVEVKVVLPDNVPDAVRSDLRAYAANSLDVAQIVDAVQTGYAPN